MVEKILPLRFIPVLGTPLNHLVASLTDPLSALTALVYWGWNLARAFTRRAFAAARDWIRERNSAVPAMSLFNAALSGAVFISLLMLTGVWFLPVIAGVVFGLQIGLILEIWVRYRLARTQASERTVKNWLKALGEWIWTQKGGRVADAKSGGIHIEYQDYAGQFAWAWFKLHEKVETFLNRSLFRFIPWIGTTIAHVVSSTTDPSRALLAALLWGWNVAREFIGPVKTLIRISTSDKEGMKRRGCRLPGRADQAIDRRRRHGRDSVRRPATRPAELYRLLAERTQTYGIDWTKVHTFNTDEFVNPPRNFHGRDMSRRASMEEMFFSRLPSDNRPVVHFLNGNASNLDEEVRRYEFEIDQIGGIDIQVLGVDDKGRIGGNEPGVSSFAARTQVVTFSVATLEDNAVYFDGVQEAVPRMALTMGMHLFRCRRDPDDGFGD